MNNTRLVSIKTLCKGRVFEIMKDYRIVVSKTLVAKFAMNYSTFGMKFKSTKECVEWIVSEHPELANAPWDYNILRNNDIAFLFYSLGNLVIVDGEE